MFFWQTLKYRWIGRSLSRGKMESKEHLRQERYLSISTCSSVKKKKNPAEEESDQWFISEMRAKPRFSKDAFSNISYVIASFFDIFTCFHWNLLDLPYWIAIKELRRLSWTLLIAQCSFDKKSPFFSFKILIICILLKFSKEID